MVKPTAGSKLIVFVQGKEPALLRMPYMTFLYLIVTIFTNTVFMFSETGVSKLSEFKFVEQTHTFPLCMRTAQDLCVNPSKD